MKGEEKRKERKIDEGKEEGQGREERGEWVQVYNLNIRENGAGGFRKPGQQRLLTKPLSPTTVPIAVRFPPPTASFLPFPSLSKETSQKAVCTLHFSPPGNPSTTLFCLHPSAFH